MPSILHIAVASPLRRAFDYLAPDNIQIEDLRPGVRVKIPFGRREMIGILLSTSQSTLIAPDKLKSALEILDDKPLFNPALLQLCLWAQDYYQHPIGDVFQNAMPTTLRQGKMPRGKWQLDNALNPSPPLLQTPLVLNEQQTQAVDAVLAQTGCFKAFLLDGVTGSGKTEVYLQIIHQLLLQGKQALVLIPEIALTPQTVKRFRDRFADPIVVLHSGLTDRQRAIAWLQAHHGMAKIVIGTRSAIFTSMPKLGVIIVDEEHDSSYKQQEGFRYHARDVAVMRARLENVPILLGTATPSLETFFNAKTNRYQTLSLPHRAGVASKPNYFILDLRKQLVNKGLSQALIDRMKLHLAKGNQVLLFLNRRGFAPVVMCYHCGWTAHCHRCDANLVLHQSPERLVCHHCGTQQKLEGCCEKCGKTSVFSFGVGTEKLELALREALPEYPVIRIDRDSTRLKGSLENLLSEITNGKQQILVGTQMLAKGHHFPNVTLVAIVDADSGLVSGDFRALERMGQLVIQVAGRAGREEKLGEVILQTYQPEHPLLNTLLKQGYHPFLEFILNERKQAALPPYAYLGLVRASAHEKSKPMQFLQEIADKLNTDPQIAILGPIPALMEKRIGYYHAQLLLSAPIRKNLQQFLPSLIKAVENNKSSRKIKWSLDIDPIEMF